MFVCLCTSRPGTSTSWVIFLKEENLLTELALQGKPHYTTEWHLNCLSFLNDLHDGPVFCSLLHRSFLIAWFFIAIISIFSFFSVPAVFLSFSLHCDVSAQSTPHWAFLPPLSPSPSLSFIFCPFLDWQPPSLVSLSPYDTSLLTCTSASSYSNQTFLLTPVLLCVTELQDVQS